MDVEQVFNNWLAKKLESFEIDDEVLGSYIGSIITSDDSDSEKKESLRDILVDLTHDVDIDELCCEIMGKWSEFYKKAKSNQVKEEEVDVFHKVALIMEKQAQPVLKPTNRTEEEEKLQKAILSRCIFVSSEEEDDNSDEGAVSTSSRSTAQNQNVEAVVQAEKEKRDKLKSEAEKKKVQDKVNREKQKQKQDERREKERKRTQKREHKR